MRENSLKTYVDRKKLLEIIKANRDKNMKIYQEALLRYREEAIDTLEWAIEDIQGGNIVNHLSLEPPMNPSENYDDIVGLLELSTEDEIELDTNDYRRFVNDNWEWKQSFLMSNSKYTKVW